MSLVDVITGNHPGTEQKQPTPAATAETEASAILGYLQKDQKFLNQMKCDNMAREAEEAHLKKLQDDYARGQRGQEIRRERNLKTLHSIFKSGNLVIHTVKRKSSEWVKVTSINEDGTIPCPYCGGAVKTRDILSFAESWDKCGGDRGALMEIMTDWRGNPFESLAGRPIRSDAYVCPSCKGKYAAIIQLVL